jgi:Zn-dependent oligopeptidase
MQLLVKLLLMRFIVSTSALLLKSRLIHSTTQLCMSTAVEAPVNPLLTPLGQLPKFDSIEPVHVKQAIEFNLAELKDKFNKFEGILRNPQSGTLTITKIHNYPTLCSLLKLIGESWGTRRIEYDFKGVVETLEEIQAPLSTTWGIVGHLMGVKVIIVLYICISYYND